MNAPGLHHVGIAVADLDRSIAFYRDLLGFSVRERDEITGGQLALVTGVSGGRVRIADLEFGDGRTLELLQYLAPVGAAVRPRPFDGGSTHIGFQVADLGAIYRRLQAAGAVTRSAPITLADAGPYWSGATVIHVLDPDGVTVELVEMPQ
jgi:catechol 2,3-dioxygenase-like lactoylglutathione lyase family enzyme